MGIRGGLRERLGRLKGSAPSTDEASNAVAARVARLRPAGRSTPGGRGPDEQALVESLGAERLAPGVLCCEERLARSERHGAVALAEVPAALVELAEVPVREWAGGGTPEPARWVFLDTETSGLAGGTGTWVFQLGVLRPVADGWCLRQYLLARLDAEAAFIEALAAEFGGTELVVTYNGKCFDAPLLATRFRLAGRGDPLAGVTHLDLLARVRRAFAPVWPDCRLASAEERLLGFRRAGDLPGSAAPQAWLDWLRHGRIAPLGAVLRHNRWDLLSLAALAVPLAMTYRDPLATGAAVQAVATHHLARGAPDRAYALLARNRARLAPPALLILADLHRRRGEWEQACGIWSELVECDDPAALEALAKYHEHRRGDPALALDLARRLPPGPAREHRCARLVAKLGRAAAMLRRP
ncbi:hypothetical protein Thimo_0678 [Thioflavicoccus mobilis 8321]|uniref:YprB ribonuclease H-like domain-containing protein n=1 Tax=Thioflavicoccus mobilis 8321 TaxID=765912 RepID=L0GUM2_9GAMM|nr:ribonuclease H-like domain-containing protein [Thioflavicoccus mobilis]AGA89517.1 hypothetical protein Thimo_0678 [Thioflavicoccus mobilis 8321]